MKQFNTRASGEMILNISKELNRQKYLRISHIQRAISTIIHQTLTLMLFCFYWPRRSLEQNSIEHAFYMLKRRLKAKIRHTRQNWRWLQYRPGRPSPGKIPRVLWSLCFRVQAVIASNMPSIIKNDYFILHCPIFFTAKKWGEKDFCMKGAVIFKWFIQSERKHRKIEANSHFNFIMASFHTSSARLKHPHWQRKEALHQFWGESCQ